MAKLSTNQLPPLSVPDRGPGLVKEFLVKGGTLRSLQLLPDSRRMPAFMDASVAMIDLETGMPVWSVAALTGLGSTSLDGDGSRCLDCRLLAASGAGATAPA